MLLLCFLAVRGNHGVAWSSCPIVKSSPTCPEGKSWQQRASSNRIRFSLEAIIIPISACNCLECGLQLAVIAVFMI